MAKHNFEEPSPELAADIVESAQQLVRLEIALAKQEVKELAITNGIAIGAFAVAGLLALLSVLVVLPVLLVVWIPNHALAALAWLILYLVAAAVLYLVGRSKLRVEAPQRTISSLKETKEWVLHQLSTSSR